MLFVVFVCKKIKSSKKLNFNESKIILNFYFKEYCVIFKKKKKEINVLIFFLILNSLIIKESKANLI